MRTSSLADAKAHLSALVDGAEHRGERVVILRHGKPAAAIVPVDVARPRPRRSKPMRLKDAERSVLAFIAEFSSIEPQVSAVDDLVRGRR